jgi:hypothetical protein
MLRQAQHKKEKGFPLQSGLKIEKQQTQSEISPD